VDSEKSYIEFPYVAARLVDDPVGHRLPSIVCIWHHCWKRLGSNHRVGRVILTNKREAGYTGWFRRHSGLSSLHGWPLKDDPGTARARVD
jgi:hypothetical protein